jgi:hypothetical protein
MVDFEGLAPLDEDDVMLFFWGNSFAALQHHNQKQGRDSASRAVETESQCAFNLLLMIPATHTNFALAGPSARYTEVPETLHADGDETSRGSRGYLSDLV